MDGWKNYKFEYDGYGFLYAFGVNRVVDMIMFIGVVGSPMEYLYAFGVNRLVNFVGWCTVAFWLASVRLWREPRCRQGLKSPSMNPPFGFLYAFGVNRVVDEAAELNAVSGVKNRFCTPLA